MKHYDYFKPKSLKEAFDLKKKTPNSRFISGGTDLMVQIRRGEVKPSALISLRSIPELSTIEMNEGVRIGAVTSINDILSHPELGKKYPLLTKAARSLGSVQIRDTATIGGNLCNCSPSADMAIALLALEARVRLQRSTGSQEISLDEFFKGPGETCLSPDEVLTDIILLPPADCAKSTFLKMGRVRMDLAIASLALVLEMEGENCRKARLAAGSVAPVPLRLYEVEALLEGKPLSRALVSDAQILAVKEVTPITDIRATESFRRHIIGVFVKRAIEELLEWNKA